MFMNTTNNTTNSAMMGIGICTYGDYQMTDNLLTSIITKTNGIKDKDYQILVVDDGTPYADILSNLENVCKKHGVRLIKNNENRGETYTLNRSVQNLNTELITIFANDITVLEPNWLKSIKYFLTQNDKIGAVGFPLEEGISGTSTKTVNTPLNTPPTNVAEVTGAAFSIKKSVFDKIINPDGSIGYWEEYVSFLEDTHLNFQLVELGYYNYILNWPSMAHTISSTFSKYPELWFRTVDWSKIEKELNGSKNEYISTVKNSRMYPDENKVDSKIIYNLNGIEMVNRLQFSRYMFSKYWKLSYDDNLLHHNELALKLFGNYYNPNTVKWLSNLSNQLIEQNKNKTNKPTKPTIYAVFRCLYGEDFIQQSIKSIDPLVDKIFIFWDNKPWGDVDHCIYKGNRIEFPIKFDNIIEKINELNNPKIILIHDHVDNNINQFTHLVNDYILPNYLKPNYVIFIEVDHVFRKDQLNKAIEEFIKKDYLVASTSQIEMWYDFNHRIPDRNRLGTIFWNMNKIDKIPPTGRHATPYELPPFLNVYNHNFGFCVSNKIMYWKHMTAIGFAEKIKDSIPNEDWYEEKWLKWNDTNNKNLEISNGAEYEIPRANLYDSSQLPETIKEDYINKNIFKL